MILFFSNPLMPVQGCGWSEPIPAQDALPSQGVSHTHTHSHGDNVTHQFTSPVHLLDVGGNQSTQRKPTPMWEEHANSTETVRPRPGINFFSHQHYNQTMLSELMLFKDLLYI